jgi:hypothetical protein
MKVNTFSWKKAKLELPCLVANKQILVAGSLRSPKSPHFKARTLQKLNIQKLFQPFFYIKNFQSRNQNTWTHN